MFKSEGNRYSKKCISGFPKTYALNLEKWCWWTDLQCRNNDADTENGLINTVGEGEGRTKWLSNIDIYTLPCVKLGFSGSSSSKESACNAEDLGSIPGSGRSPGEGNGYHSSILAWKIPWTEEPCRLQFTGSQRVGHDWATNTSCLSYV